MRERAPSRPHAFRPARHHGRNSLRAKGLDASDRRHEGCVAWRVNDNYDPALANTHRILEIDDHGFTSVTDLRELLATVAGRGAFWRVADGLSLLLYEHSKRDDEAVSFASTTQMPGRGEVLLGGRAAFLVKRPGNPLPSLITLGRAANCDLVFPIGTVSKVHAYLRRRTEGWSLVDQRSTNNTTLNGKPVQGEGERLLTEGDVVGIGPEAVGVFLSPAGLLRRLGVPVPVPRSA